MSQITVLPPESAPTADGVKPGGWWHASEDGTKVMCDLCPRGCSLAEGKRGFCFVRQNLGGRMVSTTYGRSSGFCIDPIEKKPLNHFYPGSSVLSFGTAGLQPGMQVLPELGDLQVAGSRCRGRAGRSGNRGPRGPAVGLPKRGVYLQRSRGLGRVRDRFARACHDAGVKTVAVTAGYITPLARQSLFAVMDAANVDLKGFTEEFYKELTSSRLAPVQDTLQWLVHESNVWLEVTNLIIPGQNDSEEHLKRMSAWFVEALGPDVPLHFTAFHPDFRMKDVPPTPPATLAKAHEIAKLAGLNYVYTGNVSDRARQSTYCAGAGRCSLAATATI